MPAQDPTPRLSDQTDSPNVEGHCAPPSSFHARERLRVLVVEDEAPTARVMSLLLERAGYAVRTAGSYKDAVRTACEWLPDLVVCDIGLPGRDGLELMRTMRRAHPALKGVVVSGRATEQDVAASREAGFSEHLAKPITIRQLREAMRRVLEQP